jgi:hypothetical protein
VGPFSHLAEPQIFGGEGKLRKGGRKKSGYHPRVVEANLADIHGWGLLEISPGRVDHLDVVHLVPCTYSKAASVTHSTVGVTFP